MNNLLYAVIPLIVGSIVGYISGLSLINQGKALSTSFALPAVRVLCSGLIAFYLLQWGIIPFILFGGSILLTMWIVIFTHNG